MEVKLCYKTYAVEMTLGAMKRFNDATGKDLWVTLLELIMESIKCDQGGVSAIDRMVRLTKIVPFETGAALFHSVIDPSLRVPMDEIRDAMARVGWLPTDRDGDMSEPYAIVLVKLALDINDAMEKSTKEPKKKADT